MRSRDPLDALVDSVSDGVPLEWNGREAIPPESRRAVLALRDVARIAEFSRELQRSPGDERTHAKRAETAPERWGALTLLEPIGAGSRGEVWRAWDATLRREVALKFLQGPAETRSGSARARTAGGDSGDQQLLDEARALARVQHPGVVAVHGIAEHEGRAGMWMELLRGPTLAEEMERRGPLPPEEVARIGLALCRALEAVDAAGLVHGDIKPSNVILEAGGRVVLTDFGLGKRRGQERIDAQRVSGTPLFMSPELLARSSPTPRSDLYALGVTLRWALEGRAPFRAQTFEDLRVEADSGPTLRLAETRPDAPAALIAAIERAMAPRASERFAAAGEMATALEGAASSAGSSDGRARAVHSRARGLRAVFAGAAALLVVTMTWLALRNVGDQLPSATLPSGPPSIATDASDPTSAPAAGPQETGAESAAPAPASFEVHAMLVDRSGGSYRRLGAGDSVAPGDRLSLEFRSSRPTWVYVLNQDDRGETYLLFPQPLFDTRNPMPSDSTVILPGAIGGRENGWTVTSAGGREHFLFVASLAPVREIESEIARLPSPQPDRPVEYAAIPPAVIQRLRGVGGVSPLPAGALRERDGTFERFAALGERETVSDAIWVRRITLENPLR